MYILSVAACSTCEKSYIMFPRGAVWNLTSNLEGHHSSRCQRRARSLKSRKLISWPAVKKNMSVRDAESAEDPFEPVIRKGVVPERWLAVCTLSNTLSMYSYEGKYSEHCNPVSTSNDRYLSRRWTKHNTPVRRIQSKAAQICTLLECVGVCVQYSYICVSTAVALTIYFCDCLTQMLWK